METMSQEVFNRDLIERLTRIETKIEGKNENDKKIEADVKMLQGRMEKIETFQSEQIGVWKVATAAGGGGSILTFIISKFL